MTIIKARKTRELKQRTHHKKPVARSAPQPSVRATKAQSKPSTAQSDLILVDPPRLAPVKSAEPLFQPPTQKNFHGFVPVSSNVVMTAELFDTLLGGYYGSIDDVTVHPEIAQHIIDVSNMNNRKIREKNVIDFAAIITEAKHINTGEPLIFSDATLINNGQHRLLAIVKAGKPIVIDFRFGISRLAFPSTDTGAKRKASDVLGIYGSTTAFAAAAAIKLVLAYERGLPTSYTGYDKRYSNPEILDGYKRWPEFDAAVNLNNKHSRVRLRNAASNAFAFMATKVSDDEAVAEFLSLVDSGLNAKPNDPTYLLRERLNGALRAGTRTETVEQLALYIKAWNHWRKGEKPRKLAWKHPEEFPKMLDLKL